MLPVSRQFPNHSEIFLKITSSQMIISSWSQGNWGLGIKPGRSTGTASPIAQANVAISEGLLCPASLGMWAHWWLSDGDDEDVGLCSQAGWAHKPFRCGHNGHCHVIGTPCIYAWFYTPRPNSLGILRWDNHLMGSNNLLPFSLALWIFYNVL